MTTIDNGSVAGATIDGEEVQEITVDGDVVWAAAADPIVWNGSFTSSWEEGTTNRSSQTTRNVTDPYIEIGCSTQGDYASAVTSSSVDLSTYNEVEIRFNSKSTLIGSISNAQSGYLQVGIDWQDLYPRVKAGIAGDKTTQLPNTAELYYEPQPDTFNVTIEITYIEFR